MVSMIRLRKRLMTMVKLPCGKQSASNSKTDYDHTELYDEAHSEDEECYDTLIERVYAYLGNRLDIKWKIEDFCVDG